MRERGVEAVTGSVPSLPEGLGEFDTIALFGNNLGLLGSPAQAPEVLAALATVTRPGAQLIGSGMDPGDGGAAHADYHAWNLHRGRARGQLRIRVRDGDAVVTSVRAERRRDGFTPGMITTSWYVR